MIWTTFMWLFITFWSYTAPFPFMKKNSLDITQYVFFCVPEERKS